MMKSKPNEPMATQPPKPTKISSRQTEDENSTETDTKTSKHREPNQKYCLGTVSNIKYHWRLKPV